jgi:competence protein ComFC
VNCGEVGAYFCLDCFKTIRWVEQPICPYCKKNAMEGYTHPYCQKKYGLDGLSSAFYFTGPIKKAVHKLKYQLITDLSTELGLLMLTSFRKQKVKFKGYELLPIPLFVSKQKERGFNQVDIFTRELLKEWGLSQTDSLQRIKNTKTQANLLLKERLRNLEAAFAVTEDIQNRQLLIVDDVFTTGATMFSVAQVLKKAGAKKVWGVSLARSQSY